MLGFISFYVGIYFILKNSQFLSCLQKKRGSITVSKFVYNLIDPSDQQLKQITHYTRSICQLNVKV